MIIPRQSGFVRAKIIFQTPASNSPHPAISFLGMCWPETPDVFQLFYTIA
ncbi:hypothetical protein D1BOALGB6SA_8260 [Olavius sp. associated proteobacterium Delta 1]|nr:hypothetical protein D1BOALGB6SA_8260 [Olavius sp. associated proteobacterium Delta 1]